MSASNSTPPLVTILCGFLGAGKTTVLQHLIKQANGRRWALVVNDVAALNIDGTLVRMAQKPEDSRDLVELGGGCVCCSSRDELAETIGELAASGRYEHILVETTGVAEPRSLAALFTQKNLFGRSLSDFAQLAALVTVIDAAHFLREWTDYQQRGGREIITGTSRPLFELMIEQAECADVIVINKCDLAGPDDLEKLEPILRGLNARAEIVRTSQGQMDSLFLLGRVRFEPSSTLGAATWLRALNHLPTISAKPAASIYSTGSVTRGPVTHEEKYGLRSFTYQARRPFVREKFHALLGTGLSGVVRAKGFFWLHEQPDEMGFLSIAGGSIRLDFLNYWWAALVENGKVARTDLPEKIQLLWQEPHGDRRQELVFIGVSMNESLLIQALDACLLE